MSESNGHDHAFEKEVTAAFNRSERVGKALKIAAAILATVFATGVAWGTASGKLAWASDLKKHEEIERAQREALQEEVRNSSLEQAEIKGYVKHIADDVHYLRAKDDRKH